MLQCSFIQALGPFTKMSLLKQRENSNFLSSQAKLAQRKVWGALVSLCWGRMVRKEHGGAVRGDGVKVAVEARAESSSLHVS